MAEPMFFISDVQTGQAADEALRAAGEGELIAEAPFIWTGVAEGPSGRAGMLGAWMRLDGDGSSIGMFAPAQQTWTPWPAQPNLWLGTELARPIRPEDLARRQMHQGEWLRLADGQEWHIPIASGLPHTWTPRGRVPKTPFAAFCAETNRLYQVAMGCESDAITFEVEWEFACQALMLNYRLTPELIGMLGLVDDTANLAIVWATMELNKIRQVETQKKKA
jgi:hypothetical protein